MRTLLRVYSWLFGLGLSLCALALSLIAIAGGVNNLKVPIFSFEGAPVTWWLLALGVAGLLAVLLSATGVFRWLLPLWMLIAFVLLFRGYFAGPYTFAGSGGFQRRRASDFGSAAWGSSAAWRRLVEMQTKSHEDVRFAENHARTEESSTRCRPVAIRYRDIDTLVSILLVSACSFPTHDSSISR